MAHAFDAARIPFRVCVFCGASSGSDPRYAEAARALGEAIGAAGYGLVFGGGNIGLMGETARAARAAAAPELIGILPQFLKGLEPPMPEGEAVELTATLQARKRRMLDLADAFVLLPGGLGTLDEFFEVLTEAQLGIHSKPIVLIDLAGFYAPLRALIAHLVAHGFAKPAALGLCRFVPDVAAAMAALGAGAPQA